MSYIDLINRFHFMQNEQAFSLSEQVLYFHLLDISNQLFWKNPFNHNNRRLCAKIGFSEPTLIKAKKGLKDRGLIDYVEGSSFKQNSIYRLIHTPKETYKKVIHTAEDSTNETAKESTKETSDYNRERVILRQDELLINDDKQSQNKKNSLSPSGSNQQEQMHPPIAAAPPKNDETKLIRPIQQCLELYLYSDMGQQAIDHIIVDIKLSRDEIKSWAYQFNAFLNKSTQYEKSFTDWSKHFLNWLQKKLSNQSSFKNHQNATRNSNSNSKQTSKNRSVEILDELWSESDGDSNSYEGVQFTPIELVN